MKIQKIQVISQKEINDMNKNKKHKTNRFMLKCKKLPK